METPSGEDGLTFDLSFNPGMCGSHLSVQSFLNLGRNSMGRGKHKVKKKYANYTYIFTVNFSNQNINKSSFK